MNPRKCGSAAENFQMELMEFRNVHVGIAIIEAFKLLYNMSNDRETSIIYTDSKINISPMYKNHNHERGKTNQTFTHSM